MYKKYKAKKSKKIVLFPLCALALIAIALVVLEKKGVIDFYHKETPTVTNNNPVDNINYSPPTQEEKEQANTQKDDNIQKTATETTKPDTAQIVIVDANQYDQQIEVRAFVSNIIENGTCSFTFTHDALTFTTQLPAYADASTTPCMNLTLDRSKFEAGGSWKVKVDYENSTIKGSTEKSFEVI